MFDNNNNSNKLKLSLYMMHNMLHVCLWVLSSHSEVSAISFMSSNISFWLFSSCSASLSTRHLKTHGPWFNFSLGTPPNHLSQQIRRPWISLQWVAVAFAHFWPGLKVFSNSISSWSSSLSWINGAAMWLAVEFTRTSYTISQGSITLQINPLFFHVKTLAFLTC